MVVRQWSKDQFHQTTIGDLVGLNCRLSNEDKKMTTQAIAPKRNSTAMPEGTARYCGLEVHVIERMGCCSLIRYQDRRFVVNTDDVMDFPLGKYDLLGARSACKNTK